MISWMSRLVLVWGEIAGRVGGEPEGVCLVPPSCLELNKDTVSRSIDPAAAHR